MHREISVARPAPVTLSAGTEKFMPANEKSAPKIRRKFRIALKKKDIMVAIMGSFTCSVPLKAN